MIWGVPLFLETPKCWGNPPLWIFFEAKGICPNARGGVCPETFTMAKDPKANAVGEKKQLTDETLDLINSRKFQNIFSESGGLMVMKCDESHDNE